MAEFETLAQELSNALPEQRERAVVGLVEMSDLRALPLLEKAAKKDPNTRVRFYAKRGMLLLRQRAAGGAPDAGAPAKASPAQPPDLRVLLTRWPRLNVEERIRAVVRLSATGDVRLLPCYTALLRIEKEPFVRSKLLVALGILGDPAGLPILKEALTDGDARVRSNAVEAIGYIGGEGALPLLFAALNGPLNPRLSGNVAAFLERGNEGPFAEYLARAFGTGREPIRRAVVRAVRLLGRERLWDILALAARDDGGPIGREARTALEELAESGKPRARALLDRIDGKTLAEGPNGGSDASTVAAGASGLPPNLANASEEERIERLGAALASGDRALLPHLAAWLRLETSGKVRSLLVRGIASLAGERAVKTLLALLDDADARVRADAIECLYPYATDPEVARLVPGKLGDPSGRVRANALVLLGRIPGFDIQKPLGDLAASEVMEDRLRAIYVMLDVERDDATLLVAPLLADDDERVRERAREVLTMLAERGDATANRLLAGDRVETTGTLELDPDDEPAAPPSGAPERRPPPPAADGARPSPAGPAPVDPVSDGAIEHDRLVYMLESDDEKERLQALRILEEIGDARAMEPVRRTLNDRSEEVRQQAGWTFRSLKERFGPEGTAPIPEASEDELERLRLRLCHREAKIRHAALREIGPAHRELGEFLVERVPVEPDPHVKATMVLVAGMLGGPKNVPALARSLRDEDARVRANAVEAIEYAGSIDVLRVLASCLSDVHPRVRANSAAALRHFDRAKVLDLVRGMARSEAPWQRAAAVGALAELGGTEVLPGLYGIVESEDNLHLVVAALKAIWAIPDPGRKARLETLASSAEDLKKRDWITKAVIALEGPEFIAGPPGAEGAAARLKPSSEDVDLALGGGGGTTGGPDAEVEDAKALERQKLARIAAHLRDDLYSKDSKARQEAAVRLGRVEHPAAIRALTVALSHSDTVVRYLARRSLKAFLEKPALFDPSGDMTHSAIRAAVAKVEAEDVQKGGPATGDFNWTLAWAGVLFGMLVLYLLFGRGGAPEEVKPARPKRPGRPSASGVAGSGRAARQDSDAARAVRRDPTDAGSVKLGGGDDRTPADEPAAAGVVDRSPAPASEEGPKAPSGSRGESVRPDDYPSESPKSASGSSDFGSGKSRGSADRAIEPEAGVSDRRDDR